MTAQELVNRGFGGYQGWGDAEANADFNATGGSGKGQDNGGGDSGGRSTGGIDLSQVPSVSEYIQGQFPGENQALIDLIMEMRSREKPLDIYGRMETEAGLPALRATSATLSKEIFNLEDALDAVEGNVAARTRESLATEAQRSGMVSAGREPLVESLTKLGTAQGRVGQQISAAEQGIGIKTQLAMQGQDMDLEPLKLRYTAIVDRNARLLTGFTADRETLLTSMYDKLNRERTLSDQDWQLAQTIASEKRSYDKQLQLAAAQAGATLNGSEDSGTLLSFIGTKAAEATAFEQRYKNKSLSNTTETDKTETERSEKKARASLISDVKGGASLETVIKRYSGEVPSYMIRNEYDLNSPSGKSTATEEEVQNWTLKPKADGTGIIKFTRPDGTVIEF